MSTTLVTGSTAGLGLEVARRLGERGETLLVHGRDEGRLAEARRSTGAAAGYRADLSSLEQVRRLAGEISDAHGRLDLLLNSAGIIPGHERRLSADGHELGLAVNYLAGFLLWHDLRPARVINVSSIGQQEIDFDDVMLERGYTAMRSYSQSKLAQILFTFELAERAPDGVTSDALHPATLMDTRMVREFMGPRGARSTVDEGAGAVMHVIDSPGTGRYFDGREESTADPQAYDAEARRRLWELGESLISTP
ncbi:MAG: SDR family NAD(P)-dependent oxidoreductase [Actinomycetota bacterium]|nr:SDR family NAD(P)-dependent oxidoreductase [Actinomycetota bacterium]MDQ3647072.1 SDR family NAD(P)-dependent oxidoreductase [Actinomycetota bacterium]